MNGFVKLGPDEFVLVPRVASEDMKRAGQEVFDSGWPSVEKVWFTMLHAAETDQLRDGRRQATRVTMIELVPDLLAALEEIEKLNGGADWRGTRTIARAAIAKARGLSQDTGEGRGR